LNSPVLFEDANLADLPVILASLDPCISCMERLVIIDSGDRVKTKTLTELTKG
jgi:Ni,Fe-hydrogenase III large subunit